VPGGKKKPTKPTMSQESPLLLQEYKEKVVPALQEQLGTANPHKIPKVVKVVINCSIGSQSDRKQALEDAVNELQLITGQKPIITTSKKAVSNFKLRIGEGIGAKVTLRGRNMYDFLLRLIRTALPKIRDFRGVSFKAFDGKGNYTLGVNDQSIFPEVELDKIKRTLGFDITIVTTADNDDAARMLLKELGMPFRKPSTATTANA
jgi:large subunit ribosomal protein L5